MKNARPCDFGSQFIRGSAGFIRALFARLRVFQRVFSVNSAQTIPSQRIFSVNPEMSA